MDPGQAPYTDPDKQVPHDFQATGRAFRVLQLNVEGLSAAKRQLIGTIAQQHEVDVICLQETHVADMASSVTTSCLRPQTQNMLATPYRLQCTPLSRAIHCN